MAFFGLYDDEFDVLSDGAMDGSPPDHIVPVGQDTRITSVTGDPASTGSSQSSITDSQGRQQVMAGASEERGIPPSRIGSDLLRFVDFIEVEEQVDESEIPQSPDNKEDTWLPEPIPGFFWAGLEESNSTDDLDRMISLGKSILAHITNDSPKRPRCLGKLGISYLYRFQRLKVLGDIEKAVDCIDGAVALTPLDDPDRPGRLSNLGSAYQLLFKRLGKHDYIHKAVSNKEEAVKLTPDDHPDRPGRLNKLGNAYRSLFECFERPGDINKAVDCFVQAVTLIPAGDPDKPGYLSNLGSAYQSSFKLFGRLDTLDKAVSCQEQAITLTPDGHPNKAVQLNSLGETYRLLFSHYDLSRDAMRALDSFKHAALMSTGPPSVRLRASNNWAQISTSLGSPSLEAYMCSLELLPHVIGLGTSIVDKYQSLAADTRDLVTEAAAVAISMQRHDLAIEWLEHGRCLIWNQLLELRTPFDDLRAAHPGIAGELQEASRLLESASMSESIEQEVTHGAESLLDATEKHRLVAEHREQLIDSARGLPGFDNFLRAPKASEIMHHVRDGAAVILNVHTLRCDALVIQPSTQSICHIPLSSFCHQKAEDARIQLAKCLRSRDTRHPVWIDEDESQTPFQDILAMLWYDVVKPVLDRLCVTNGLPADELPHITWCITGPLSFLPLHAAGDYSSPSSVLSNLAVSSYIPNVSSLSRPNLAPEVFSGILLVGHSLSTRGLSTLPGATAELDQVQKQFKGLQCTRLSDQDACTDPVLQAMADHSWVHFACHASQNPCYPLKSALHLHDGDLELATISRNPMKNAQLAFLSACQTATGDSALPDEAMHLAAGLLMMGYPAVIATMWSINDADAPIVAGKVYECLLEGGVPDSGRVAVALHKATAHLRNTTAVGNFARWVPYIHVGR